MLPADDARISKACAGDTAALSDLLREHGPRVRALLSIDPRWQSVLDVDDVLQVSYMEAFLQIASFVPGGDGAFVAWLRRIAENNLRDAIRALEAQKRPPPAVQMRPPSADESAVALLEQLGVTQTTPSRAVAAGEVRSVLDDALARMPQDYARVIRTYDLEGRAIGDVAAQLGRSPGAVHMLRARAHDQLRSLLGPGTNFFSRPA